MWDGESIHFRGNNWKLISDHFFQCSFSPVPPLLLLNSSFFLLSIWSILFYLFSLFCCIFSPLCYGRQLSFASGFFPQACMFKLMLVFSKIGASWLKRSSFWEVNKNISSNTCSLFARFLVNDMLAINYNHRILVSPTSWWNVALKTAVMTFASFIKYMECGTWFLGLI